MSERRDLGAEHNTCEACGDPIPSTGGTALLCGGSAGGSQLTLPAPRFCTSRECQAARDQAAIERAIERGIITP